MSLQKLSKDVKNVRRFMSSGAPKLMKKFKILHWISMGQNSPLSKCLSPRSQIWHPEHLQKHTNIGTKCQPVKQFNNSMKLRILISNWRGSAPWTILPYQKVQMYSSSQTNIILVRELLCWAQPWRLTIKAAAGGARAVYRRLRL